MGEAFKAAALASDRQAGEQRVGKLQGLVEISPATHPVEVAAGMLFGVLAAQELREICLRAASSIQEVRHYGHSF
jgi:ammonia channel protein AmtB